jgi:hypothetical protein
MNTATVTLFYALMGAYTLQGEVLCYLHTLSGGLRPEDGGVCFGEKSICLAFVLFEAYFEKPYIF